MTKYNIKISILSLAPQVQGTELIVNGKALRLPNTPINEKGIKQSVKSLFPTLSLVSFKDINFRTSNFRQEIEITLTSLRKIKKELQIDGINPSFYDFKVSELDA